MRACPAGNIDTKAPRNEMPTEMEATETVHFWYFSQSLIFRSSKAAIKETKLTIEAVKIVAHCLTRPMVNRMKGGR